MSEDEKTEETERSELNILFPALEVPLTSDDKGPVVKVRPLPLDKLPKVLSAFTRILELRANSLAEVASSDTTDEKLIEAEIGHQNLRLLEVAMDEILILLPSCVDRKLEEIPASAFPDIAAAWVEQNVTDDVVKKWSALAGDLVGAADKGRGLTVPSQKP